MKISIQRSIATTLLAGLLLFTASCATTASNTSPDKGGDSPEKQLAGPTPDTKDDEVYSYYSVPQRSENLVFTIYKAYTFPADKALSEDEGNLIGLAFLFGMQYCSTYAGEGDNLAVTFVYDNRIAKAFICTYKDFKLFSDGALDFDSFWKRVSMEEVDY